MKHFLFVFKGVIVLILTLLLSNCDEEIILPPDEIPLFTQELNGKVILENQSEHSNALVYLDSLNRGAGTDSTGSYRITFNDRDSIYNGVFTLYYFVNEFDMDSAKYALVNGKVKLDSLDVDKDGNLPVKNLKQLLHVEGWTNKYDYEIGDTLIFTAKFTNVSNDTVKIFIPSCFGTFGFVSLYNQNHSPSFILGGICDPVTADCEVDIYPGGYYEGTEVYIIPSGVNCSGWRPLPFDYFIVNTGFFINGRLLSFFTKDMDHYIITEWYKFHLGNPTEIDAHPNKYKFPIISIVE